MATEEAQFVFERKLEKALNDAPREMFFLEGHTTPEKEDVVKLIRLIDPQEHDRILEVGFGTGWMSCLLAKVCNRGRVFSTQQSHELVNFAKERVMRLGILNLEIVEADGMQGYAPERPYDKIVCMKSVSEIPDAWKVQIKEGGMIIAVINDNMTKFTKLKGKMQELSA